MMHFEVADLVDATATIRAFVAVVIEQRPVKLPVRYSRTVWVRRLIRHLVREVVGSETVLVVCELGLHASVVSGARSRVPARGLILLRRYRAEAPARSRTAQLQRGELVAQLERWAVVLDSVAVVSIVVAERADLGVATAVFVYRTGRVGVDVERVLVAVFVRDDLRVSIRFGSVVGLRHCRAHRPWRGVEPRCSNRVQQTK